MLIEQYIKHVERYFWDRKQIQKVVDEEKEQRTARKGHTGGALPRTEISVLPHGHHGLARRAIRRVGAGRKRERGGHARHVLRGKPRRGHERSLRDRVFGVYHDLFSLRVGYCGNGEGSGRKTGAPVRRRADGRRVRALVSGLCAFIFRRAARNASHRRGARRLSCAPYAGRKKG